MATGSAILTHASGVISQVVGVWAPPATPFRYTFHVAGTDGTVPHDSLAHPACASPAPAAEADGDPDRRLRRDPVAAQIREFAAAFRAARPRG